MLRPIQVTRAIISIRKTLKKLNSIQLESP